MKHKFTSSPWGFRFWDFAKYCAFMEKTGIEDICVQFGDPGKFRLSLTSEKSSAEDYRATADKHGLRIIEAATTKDYEKEISAAGILGAEYLRVCSVWEDTEEKFREVAAMLKRMGEAALESGKTVVVENHGGLMTEGVKCRRLLEEVGMDNVRLNYDPANFLFFGEDPLKALDGLLPLVGFTHFKSVKYIDGKPRYCRLSEGVIDNKKIFDRLLPAYGGYIGLEYEEASDVEKGTADDFRFIKELLGSR